MRAAKVISRMYWDFGFVMECAVCGLLVPVYTDNSALRGCPVPHYPVLDEHRYTDAHGAPLERGYCRGGGFHAGRPSEQIQLARESL